MKKSVLAAGTAFAIFSALFGPTLSSPALAVNEQPKAGQGYSDSDVVALLINGTGAIAERHPQVAEELGFPTAGAGVPNDIIESLTSTLQSEVPSFHEDVTVALTSGDPYRIESGLRAMESSIQTVGKVRSSGAGVGYCAVNPLVFLDTFGAVAQLVVYDSNAFWGRSNSYWLTTAQTSDLGIQDLSAKIASELS